MVSKKTTVWTNEFFVFNTDEISSFWMQQAYLKSIWIQLSDRGRWNSICWIYQRIVGKKSRQSDLFL